MGGLAGAAGGIGLSEPLWLDGGGAALTVAADAPTVWWFSLDDPGTVARADTVAPLPGEAAAYARHRDAGERTVRRRLARLLLGKAGSCAPSAVVIVLDEAGAPTVVSPAGWHLSAAARWPEAVIAVAPMPVGVDLERMTYEPPLVEALTLAERHWLAGLAPADRPAAFTACWARKEAHAKWSRHPLALDPADIETAEHGIVRSRFGITRSWQQSQETHVTAVCISA